MMKLTLFACLAAAAMAEPKADADAQYLTTYRAGYTNPVAYSNYGYGFPSTYGYGLRNYGYSRFGYGKREAEAEPEADAQYVTSYRAGYTPVAYSNYGYGFPSTYGYGLRNFGYSRFGYGKREAKAEPEADAQYLTTYRAGYTTPVAYSNYGYGFPSTYGYGLRNFGYSRFGYGKREAEAKPEADAQYLTSYRAGYAPVAYSNYGYGFPSTYRYGLRNFGYSRFGYGKREADAEPEADAQYLTSYRAGYTTPVAYSNYGYGFPSTYGYGLRNFGYSRFGYGKREAEAEPEADAQYLTSYRAGYASPLAYSNYGYNYPTTYGYGLRNFGYSRFGYHG